MMEDMLRTDGMVEEERYLGCSSLLPRLRMAGQEEEDGITKRCNRGQRRRATVAKMAEVDSNAVMKSPKRASARYYGTPTQTNGG